MDIRPRYPIGIQSFEKLRSKGYLIPYAADGRTLVKIGVSFDAEEYW